MPKSASKKNAKRAFPNAEQDDIRQNWGVGETFATLNQHSNNTTTDHSKIRHGESLTDTNGANNDATKDDEGWTTVLARKKRKTSENQNSASSSTSSAYPSISHSAQARPQKHVKVPDLQNLVYYLFGNSYAPQWVAVKNPNAIRKIVVLMVPGLEPDMFRQSQARQSEIKANTRDGTATSSNPDFDASATDAKVIASSPQPETAKPTSPDDYYPVELKAEQLTDAVLPFSRFFSHMWPISSTGEDKVAQLFSDQHTMLTTSLHKTAEEKNAVTSGPRPPVEAKNWTDKPTCITNYLTLLTELREDQYPLHPALLTNEDEKDHEAEFRRTNKRTADDGWVDSEVSSPTDYQVSEEEIEAGSLTAGCNIIAIDCEMCQTADDSAALTRISAVGWKGEVLLDELVKPPSPITDYLTRFSGITAEKLDPVTTTVADVQKRLLALLTPRTILVGHSLVSDLTALKLTHPFIIDTSFLYPHPRGPPFKSSLKFLAQRYLSRSIQTGHGTQGHDSVEDARATMDLVKLKCERGPTWGTPEASRESIFTRLQRISRPGSVLSRLSGADVEWGSIPGASPRADADVKIPCENDEQVVDGVRRAVFGDEDGLIVPGGGVDFVFARLRSLEAVKGWWSHDRNFELEKLRIKARSKYTTSLGTNAPSQQQQQHQPDTSQPSTAPKPAPDSFNAQYDDSLPYSSVTAALSDTIANIRAIHSFLPPTTALIVFSGALSTRKLEELKRLHRQYKREYETKKWDELSVKWGEEDEKMLKAEYKRARGGVGFLCVK